jgi:hypothetical protein
VGMNNCPHCHVSLVGPEIAADKQHFYNALDAVPGDEGWVTHFRREIAVEVRGVYDGALYMQCPDCSGQWHRFDVGDGRRALAERYMK